MDTRRARSDELFSTYFLNMLASNASEQMCRSWYLNVLQIIPLKQHVHSFERLRKIVLPNCIYEYSEGIL